MITRALVFRSLFAALACLVSVSTFAAANDYQLPTIGQPADAYLSPAEEDKLGRQVVSQLLSHNLIIEDVELREYLNAVGARLAQHTSHAADAFHFYVIDSGQINAFALPGGYIGVNAGLITETDNESELAGVMGHEMAHVTQRHIARQIEATSGMGWATAAAVIVAAIAGGGDPDAISAAVAAGVSNLGQQQTNYTRAHEFEADRVGIRTMATSGFNPDAMASFFEKLQKRSQLYGTQLPEILLSHPVSNTRMAEAEARARDYPSPKIDESAAYPLMKERARVLANRQLSDLSRYYQQRRGATDKPTPALDYGYALVLTQLGQNDAAIALLAPLATAAPDQLAYKLALANAYSQSGKTGDARNMLLSIQKQFPHSAAAKLDYARLLIQSDEPKAARQFLLGEHALIDQSSDAQQMLAQAASQDKNLGEAYYRQARYFQLRGAYPQAINQLRAALQTAQLNAFDKARLRALLQQMVQSCHAAWSPQECRRQVEDDTRY
ncbi:M48 family metalloprotease [Salinisphaera aquimarina]|uniref:M48 family metalloprotease n=1 Tax=Salinisphaera aquimarina TaxID=2094031 RepID=A0ABV7ESG9_9GAMM